jgi:hypothetical protein
MGSMNDSPIKPAEKHGLQTLPPDKQGLMFWTVVRFVSAISKQTFNGGLKHAKSYNHKFCSVVGNVLGRALFGWRDPGKSK